MRKKIQSKKTQRNIKESKKWVILTNHKIYMDGFSIPGNCHCKCNYKVSAIKSNIFVSSLDFFRSNFA